jgi:hypothetical protein
MIASHTMSRRVPFVALVAALVAGLSAGPLVDSTGAAAAAGATPSAQCQPYATTPCLLPFPNDLFTTRDRTSATGLRIRLPAGAMPVNKAGRRVAVAPYDRNDGFSPGSTVVVHVPGLDNAQAWRQTAAVPLTDMRQAFAPQQPIVIIDESTGRRQLLWAELDANAKTPQTTNLLIHPGRNFAEGHTYVAALRGLRGANRRLIPAPRWFALLRDGKVLPPAERSQRGRYTRIFDALQRAGISRNGLYEAWDFTIASRQGLSSRMLAIRNDAFARLGDDNLADNKLAGRAPAFTVTSSDALTPALRRVQGTFTVPCYLTVCGPSATTGFSYGSRAPDALPRQLHGNFATAQFECIVPTTPGSPHSARPSLYGHGLLGGRGEVEAGNVQAMATEHNMVFCATDWWGLANPDTAYDAGALADLNQFPNVIDRLQQGVLNFLYLGRLMVTSSGFASNAAFQLGGHSVIDASHLYYDGNSQGGIEGGITTAVSPDFRMATLGVSGMNYANVLVQRSTDFAPFGAILFASYPQPSLDPVILDLMQQLWDRGEPDGYAQHMTSNPLPDTPSHQVLMQIAYGDHQVSMYAAATEARTIGAAVHTPALDLSPSRSRDRNLFFDVPAIAHYPFHGSAIVIWDSGPGRVQPPPVANLAPVNGPANHDPHEDVRNTPAARSQKSSFLTPGGVVFDVCGGKPCHTSVYAPGP